MLSTPAPDPAPAPTPAPVPTPLRLSPVSTPVRDTGSLPALSFQELLQPAKTDIRPRKRKKKRGRKLVVLVLLVGGVGGYMFRNAEPVQRLFGHGHEAKPLPVQPFVRPNITSAEYTVTLAAVQNGVPNNVTTTVKADYINGVGESTVESQNGGEFSTSDEIRTRDFLFHPDPATIDAWTRQPRVADVVSPYDTAAFIPMIDGIVDQTLRDATEPQSSRSEKLGETTITTLKYRLDRARVPEIAPAIYAMVPWLYDVPNATTLTVEVSYDDSGLVRHLFFGVDPPQPGTGAGATWVTGYTLDVTAVDLPIAITVPATFVDVPAGTP